MECCNSGLFQCLLSGVERHRGGRFSEVNFIVVFTWAPVSGSKQI